jgi:hypothetical protein
LRLPGAGEPEAELRNCLATCTDAPLHMVLGEVSMLEMSRAHMLARGA